MIDQETVKHMICCFYTLFVRSIHLSFIYFLHSNMHFPKCPNEMKMKTSWNLNWIIFRSTLHSWSTQHRSQFSLLWHSLVSRPPLPLLLLRQTQPSSRERSFIIHSQVCHFSPLSKNTMKEEGGLKDCSRIAGTKGTNLDGLKIQHSVWIR